MPSFAELKEKATKVAGVGVDKLQHVKDNNTSVPLNKTNWDPYAKRPPPPPPAPKRAGPPKPYFPPPPSRTGGADPASSSPGSSTEMPPLPNRSNSFSAAPAGTDEGPAPTIPRRLPPSASSSGFGATRAAFSSLSPPAGRVLASASDSALNVSINSAGLPPPPVARSSKPSLGGESARSASPSSASSKPAVPPSRFASSAPASPPPPPPPTRSPYAKSAVENAPPALSVSSSPGRIDWTNLTQEDKEVFFGWLDEFFSRFLKVDIPARSATSAAAAASRDADGEPTAANSSPRWQSQSSSQKPPPPQGLTKPSPFLGGTKPSPQAGSSSNVNFDISYPPRTTHGSAALDLAHYWASSASSSDTSWYSTSNLSTPPTLQGNTNIYWTASWESLGAQKTINYGILFSDLSTFWGTISVPGSNQTHRFTSARLPVPSPVLDRAVLLDAHETYGETIASFAESYAGSGEYCSRGECWDLASEALKYFDGFDYVPKPVWSIARTHGHLIFEGRAVTQPGVGAPVDLVGRWRGGDDRVRRGDIIEWRTAKISTKNPQTGRVTSWATLGDPDHTAIIVQDAVPSVSVSHGQFVSPKDLGTIVVVEQGVGNPPERREYNLAGMEEGEVWIYRPISIQTYLGITEVGAKAPEDHPGLQYM